MRVIDNYYFFVNGFCSNWYKSPFKMEIDGLDLEFVTVEQYMMYMKAKTFGDEDVANAIMNTNNPRKQKELGRKVRGYDDTVWSKVRYGIVKNGVFEKFNQSKELKSELWKIKDYHIVEAASYDRVWGIGYGEDDPKLMLEKDNWGENLLGKCLMDASKVLFGVDY